MIKVYIASPYTHGDVVANVRYQIDVANELMNLGFCPYTPLLSHFHHLVHQRSYTDWMAQSREWLQICDCLLRLSGVSDGADNEVSIARQSGKPIFLSIEKLQKFYL